jgi:hypothetical protein
LDLLFHFPGDVIRKKSAGFFTVHPVPPLSLDSKEPWIKDFENLLVLSMMISFYPFKLGKTRASEDSGYSTVRRPGMIFFQFSAQRRRAML